MISNEKVTHKSGIKYITCRYMYIKNVIYMP